eukprot:1163517-Prymnesium_polylepis.1
MDACYSRRSYEYVAALWSRISYLTIRATYTVTQNVRVSPIGHAPLTHKDDRARTEDMTHHVAVVSGVIVGFGARCERLPTSAAVNTYAPRGRRADTRTGAVPHARA